MIKYETHRIYHNGKLVDVADCPILAVQKLAEASKCDLVIEAITKGWKIIRTKKEYKADDILQTKI